MHDPGTPRVVLGRHESFVDRPLRIAQIAPLYESVPPKLYGGTERYENAVPVGPENDVHIVRCARESALMICAWGAHGDCQARGLDVADKLRNYQLNCFSLTGSGQPKHPLYMPAASPLAPFESDPAVAKSQARMSRDEANGEECCATAVRRVQSSNGRMRPGKGSVGTPMALHRRRRPKKALTSKKLADHHQAMLRKRFPKDKPTPTRPK